MRSLPGPVDTPHLHLHLGRHCVVFPAAALQPASILGDEYDRATQAYSEHGVPKVWCSMSLWAELAPLAM